MDCFAPFLLGFVRLGLGPGRQTTSGRKSAKSPYARAGSLWHRKVPGTHQQVPHTTSGPSCWDSTRQSSSPCSARRRLLPGNPHPTERWRQDGNRCPHSSASTLQSPGSGSVTGSHHPHHGAEERVWSDWRENSSSTSLQRCISPSRMGSALSPHPAPGLVPSSPTGALQGDAGKILKDTSLLSATEEHLGILEGQKEQSHGV